MADVISLDELPRTETCEATRLRGGLECWCRLPMNHEGEHRCSCGYTWPRRHPTLL